MPARFKAPSWCVAQPPSPAAGSTHSDTHTIILSETCANLLDMAVSPKVAGPCCQPKFSGLQHLAAVPLRSDQLHMLQVLDVAVTAGHTPDVATWHTLLQSTRYLDLPEVAQQARVRAADAYSQLSSAACDRCLRVVCSCGKQHCRDPCTPAAGSPVSSSWAITVRH